MQRATNLNFQYMFMTVFIPIFCRPKNNWYLYVFKTNPLPPESKCKSRLFSQDVWSLGPSELLFRCWVENTSSVVFSVLVRTGRDGVFPLIESMDSCFGCSLTLGFLLEGIFMDWMGLVDLHRFTLGYFPTQKVARRLCPKNPIQSVLEQHIATLNFISARVCWSFIISCWTGPSLSLGREGLGAKEETTSTDFFWNKVRKQRLDKGIGAFGTIVVAIYGIICLRLPYHLSQNVGTYSLQEAYWVDRHSSLFAQHLKDLLMGMLCRLILMFIVGTCSLHLSLVKQQTKKHEDAEASLEKSCHFQILCESLGV